MAKSTKNENTPVAAAASEAQVSDQGVTDAGASTTPGKSVTPQASSVAAGEQSGSPAAKAKRANPLTNDNHTHVDQGRFCIQPKVDEAGNPIGQEILTDNVHFAYAKRSEGHKVIDHHHGNREYDGTVPGQG